jgi:hypothetical protein
MGWSWEHRIAFGIYVKSRISKIPLKLLLKRYEGKINYMGHPDLIDVVFVYLNSSYQCLNEADGSYAYSSPDPSGDKFNEPKHPIFHKKIEEGPESVIKPSDLGILHDIKQRCECLDGNPIWVEDASIDY